MAVVFADAAPAEGIHDLRPAGPWPMPGTVPPVNGRVPGSWACTRCSRTAGDTSRAKELSRKPCSGADWSAEAATHALVPLAEGWHCTRCLLTARPQHAAQTARQQCPVPSLSRAGAAWPEGEAGIRSTFGRIKAFRHFCCPAEAEEQPEQQAQPQQLAQQLRVWQPAAAAAAAEPEAAAAAGAPAGAGPLLAAAGPEARRALKRQPGPGEPLDVLQVPRADVGLVAGGGSAGEAAELQEEPAATRRRLSFEPAVSPFFALQPYALHKVAHVGRNLWCLDCFEVPGSAHRSWRHGRCGGAKPPMSMPPALRDCILRQPAACPKLQAGTRSRWTVLAGALGLL